MTSRPMDTHPSPAAPARETAPGGEPDSALDETAAPGQPARRERIRRKTLAVLPSLITLGNLACGMASIFYIMHASKLTTPASNFQALRALDIAAWLIFAGMVFDMLDGMVARMTKSASDFGAQLDSLCDMITFGVAPAALVYRITPLFKQRLDFLHADPTTAAGRVLWAVTIMYVLCACLRLARFNVVTTLEEESHRYFTGLPSPAAAGVIASLVILYFDYESEFLQRVLQGRAEVQSWMSVVLPLVTLLVAVLMVSRIRYPHAANWVLRGRRPPAFLLVVLLSLIVFFIFTREAMALGFVGFALLGPVYFVYRLIMRPSDDPLTPEEEQVF